MSEFEKGKDMRQKKYFSVNKVVTSFVDIAARRIL